MVQSIEPGWVLRNPRASATSTQLVTTTESKRAQVQMSSEIDLRTSSCKRPTLSRISRSFRRRLEPPHAHPSKLQEISPHESLANDTSLLNRDLQGRHMQMIAIGGAIGTGLFVGSGSALATGGPAALMIGFGLIGIMLFFVVHALGELAVMFPIAGNSAQVKAQSRIIFNLLNSVY